VRRADHDGDGSDGVVVVVVVAVVVVDDDDDDDDGHSNGDAENDDDDDHCAGGGTRRGGDCVVSRGHRSSSDMTLHMRTAAKPPGMLTCPWRRPSSSISAPPT
jgi:hypothetical protein